MNAAASNLGAELSSSRPIRSPLGSVVIPAHNEASVIDRCLTNLLEGFAAEELDVLVVCNGCRDDTAARARAWGSRVHVIELAQASKPAALRAGDSAARAFPRLYLDADVILAGPAARRVLDHLRAGAIAARPPIRYDTGRCSPLVRSYYRARERVPAVMGSLWGAGVCGLSAAGRRRFREFPDLVADDLWLDRQYDPAEIEIVDCIPVLVAAPRRTRDLLNILRRTYRGKAGTRPERGIDRRAREITKATLVDLGKLACAGPKPAIDGVIYALFAIGARLSLALRANSCAAQGAGHWERDDSSRRD
jgi:glycosyltransferase involved in cell wall biosynthesis